jgi:hypothetical protein
MTRAPMRSPWLAARGSTTLGRQLSSRRPFQRLAALEGYPVLLPLAIASSARPKCFSIEHGAQRRYNCIINCDLVYEERLESSTALTARPVYIPSGAITSHRLLPFCRSPKVSHLGYSIHRIPKGNGEALVQAGKRGSWCGCASTNGPMAVIFSYAPAIGEGCVQVED